MEIGREIEQIVRRISIMIKNETMKEVKNRGNGKQEEDEEKIGREEVT